MSEIQFQNTTFISRRQVGKIQTAESVRLSVKTDISQVLSVGTDSAIQSYEVTNGEASFSGKTNIKLLYTDGTGILSAGYNADFTASISSERLSADSKLTFDVVTVDSKVDVNANTVTLTLLLEVTAYAYCADSLPCMAHCDDIFCRSDSVEQLSAADVVNLPLILDEQLNAGHNISTVLLAESSLCITDHTCADGILHVSGEAAVRLTYLSDGELITDALPFVFERELDASGIAAGSMLSITATPRNTKVRLELSDDINTAFTVEIAANVCVESAVVDGMQLVTDAYGTDCDFTFERQSVTATLPCGSTVQKRRISSALPSDADRQPLTAVNVGCIITDCKPLSGSVQIDGVVFATLLYMSDGDIASEPLEVPFSQNVDAQFVTPSCQCHATVAVGEFTVRQQGGLQAETELCFTVSGTRDVNYQVIVGAEQTPFDKKQLPAIEVCLARKGETLWQLAKGLHMSEEDLLSVNPEISNPLQQDARIVVFNKI